LYPFHLSSDEAAIPVTAGCHGIRSAFPDMIAT
jgi:hypothetical protein